MGYKNRTHRQKRIISERKFNRIFVSNLHKAGVAYRSENLTAQRSLAACKVGDIVYAKFTCKTQPTDRLQTFCIRYRADEEILDFIAFVEYASKYQAIRDMSECEGAEIF